MSRCEDYPCCGHGPPPQGDGGVCPDEEGRFNCVLCGVKLPRGATSSICNGYHPPSMGEDAFEGDDYDY